MPINPQTLKRLQENDPDIVGLNLTLEVDSDEDVLKLVKALKDNTYLRSLTIQGIWNKPGIGDRSAVLLRSCCHLVYLDLSFNKRITNIGAEALALAKNSAIEDLFLRGCSVTPEGLVPFLKNDTVLDLRIAISAAPSEQVGEAITLKLKENARFRQQKFMQFQPAVSQEPEAKKIKKEPSHSPSLSPSL